MYDKKRFKDLFNEKAKHNGFFYAYGCWFKESNECILILELQKSNYSNLYYLNMKIFIQGANKRIYKINKDLIKNEIGHGFRRSDKEFDQYFNLDLDLEYHLREQGIELLFNKFLIPFTRKAMTLKGVIELYNDKLLMLYVNSLPD
jgi:hypothetical protein